MEAKLKTLRVADLRELLQKASVAIPAKANKADLIAKIIATPAAANVFNGQSAPAATPAVAKPKAPDAPQGGQDDDLLAPPEEFDWGPTASNEASASSEVPPASSKTIPAKSSNSMNAPAKPSAAQKPLVAAATATTELSHDEEAEKRQKRAARFGIPVVEAKPNTTPSAAPAAKETKAPRKNAQTITAEDAAKTAARAARFGIPQATTNTAATGRKRARSPAPVDKDELEKRKKRAERFGNGGETKVQT